MEKHSRDGRDTMSINVWCDPMQCADLFGKPVLFTNWLIPRDTVPQGWY